MIHRAMLGSLERFLGVYIEHCAGAFPIWLAPVQVVVIGITDQQTEYISQIVARLDQAGIRVEADTRNEKIGYKIREAEVQKVPYMLVVGAREEEASQVAVRQRGSGDQGTTELDDFIRQVEDEVSEVLSPASA